MKLQRLAFFLIIGSLFPAIALAQSELISPFEGSEEVGRYETRFAELPLLVPPLQDRNVPTVETVEGALVSNIYRRPEGVTPFEVYRSYLDALQQGGFEILLDCQAPDCNLTLSITPVYRGPIRERNYGRLPMSTDVYLTGFPLHYLSAVKTLADRTYHAVILISRERGLYSVDVLESAERKADTVTLSEAMLSARLTDEGRSVLEGIFFEIGNAVITPESAPALEVITSYLSTNPGTRYYVVGHTDDTGSLQANLTLSSDRASSVVAALVERGVDAARLSSHGVGPFSPVATNRSETGRSVNRRVELVLRLE